MYLLSKQLAGRHEGEVRCGCLLANKRIVTGGLDSNIFVWSPDLRSSPLQVQDGHSDFVYAVCPHPFNGDWFISGGKDKKVFVFDSISGEKILSVETDRVHTGPVCSVAAKENILVVGAWDGSFSVWSLESGALIRHQPQAGTFAVTVTIDERKGEIVTASQDKSIKFWSLDSGNCIAEIPNAHNDIIRSIAVDPESGALITASNDCLLKMWIDKKCVFEFIGHENFVFSVSCLWSAGLCASSGEDRTARIWRDETCVQTIKHPGTVWFVFFIESEIVTGCSDGVVRVFSSNERDWAQQEEINAFEALIPAEEDKAGEKIDPATVPLETSMFRYRGNRIGEIKMFKDAANTVFAYQWTDSGVWEKVGLVTGGLSNRKFFQGDQLFPKGDFDFVFDVDLGSGRIALLPFNKTDNPLVAAEKFCAREAINKSHVSQITDFIRQNAGPLSAASVEEHNVVSSQHFPLLNMFLFKEAKWPQLLAKIKQDNNESLSEEEVVLIENVIATLSQTGGVQNRDFRPVEIALIHSKLPLIFPPESLFVVFDLWRLFVLHPASAVMYKDSDQGSQYLLTAARQLQANMTNNTGLCAARFLANLFGSSVSKWAAFDRSSLYLQAVKQTLCAVPAVLKPTQIACASIIANLASSTTEKKTAKSIELANHILELVVDILKADVNLEPEAVYRLLVALGSAIISSRTTSLTSKEEVAQVIKSFSSSNKAAAVIQVCSDIAALL